MFKQPRFLFRLLGLALALGLVHETKQARAAEIVCAAEYGGRLATAEWGVRLARLEESGIARKVWPSGYRPSRRSCRVALLRGTIQKGDYKRFRAFYKQHHRALTSLYLFSLGGDAEEAMKIGRMVRKYLINTVAPTGKGDIFASLINPNSPGREPSLCLGPSCICASACGLIWFGAVDRSGTVGMHRPKITDPQFAALPPGEASKVYRHALQKISRYLEEMEAPRPLIDAMVATSSSDIRWVDAFKDINLEYPPSFAEWVDASCGSLTSQELKAARELGARRGLAKSKHFAGKVKPLTAQEEMLLKVLWEKVGKRTTCASERVHARRDALPSP